MTKLARASKLLVVLLVVAALGVATVVLTSGRTQFELGGMFVNLGYRMQDTLHAYDFEHDEVTPDQVWSEFQRQNALASGVRSWFPRSTEHPLVALLVCMDARLDTSEIVGDTRRYYYVVRTAGSVLDEKEEEMLELAVRHGVKVIVLTTHTDCAAERAAATPESRQLFPALTKAVDDRERRVEEFLRRPAIAERIASGQLLIERLVIDTRTDELVMRAP